MPETVLDWGIDLILQLQAAFPGWTISLLNIFTFLGNEEWYLLMMPFVFWCVDARLGLRLAVLLSLGNSVTAAFKLVFHAPRPYWIDTRVRLLAAGDPYFGIPSGHSLNGVVIWGAVAQAIRSTRGWIAAGAIILLVGISRVVLGVHFPTDVLVGWAIGIVLLFLLTKIEGPVVRWYRKLGRAGQVGAVLGLALWIMLSGSWTAARVGADFDLPAEWAATAAIADPEEPIDPLDASVFVTNAGVLFGAVTGFTWLHHHGGFNAGGPWSRRILRYAAGLVVAVAIWAGLDLAFAAIADDATLLGMILRFVRYTLLGLWVGAAAPRVFIRLGWAAEE